VKPIGSLVKRVLYLTRTYAIFLQKIRTLGTGCVARKLSSQPQPLDGKEVMAFVIAGRRWKCPVKASVNRTESSNSQWNGGNLKEQRFSTIYCRLTTCAGFRAFVDWPVVFPHTGA
jgi:hypothetical protein